MPTPDSPLYTLARVYFGEDSDLFAADTDGVLRASPRSTRTELVAEIEDALLRDPSESALQELWSDSCRSAYRPQQDGRSYREWFDHMLEVLGGRSE